MDGTPGGVRVSDPDTSHHAAQSFDAARLEAMVLEQMAVPVSPGVAGWTCHELCLALGMTHQTVSPRFAPLTERGVIRDSGDRRPGRAPPGFKKDGAPRSGRMQIVWELTGKAPVPRTREKKMDRKELDDALYGAMMDALSNAGLPITARGKARMADELTAEAVRLALAQMKAEGNLPTAPVKAKRTRGPNKLKATKAEAAQPSLPHVPADASTPAPFGQHSN